jgi:hypothetical protein
METQTIQQPVSGSLLTIKQLVERYPELTEGSVRWAVHHAESNGLAACGAIKRKSMSGHGRRQSIRIDVPKFFGWWAA